MNLFKRFWKILTNGKNLLLMEGTLRVSHFIPDPNGAVILDGVHCREIKEDRRKVTKCVTTAYAELLVDELQASEADHSLFKYHDSGTGVVAEDVGDTALGTPCGEARDIGTQEEGATSVIYKSVATHTYAGAFAITEHGLFNAAAAGTLMDRSKFDAVNVVATEKITFDYQLSVVAGG